MNKNGGNVEGLVSLIIKSGLKSTSIAWFPNNNKVRCLGGLQLSHNQDKCNTFMLCCFEIDLDWQEKGINVWCFDSRLKKSHEWKWHINAQGKLCYERIDYWKKKIREYKKEYGIKIMTQIASTWCINSSRELLYKHLIMYRHKSILDWPDRWDDWKHDRAEAAEQEIILTRKGELL